MTLNSVDNPYGLDALWSNGDLIAHATLVILVAMSLATWYILFLKLIEQSRLLKEAKEASERYWPHGDASSLSATSAFRYLAEAAQFSAENFRAGDNSISRDTWISLGIQRALDLVQSRLQGGMTLLATVGSTAPFIGLFGTVWGIYHALTAIGIAGQASIDKVAGPVGEALIMTAIGLAVAVPAVLGYNWLLRRNKLALEKIRGFGVDVHAFLLTGQKIGQ